MSAPSRGTTSGLGRDASGVTLRAVATAFGLELRGGTVVAEGDLDFRGTLGVDRDAMVGFREIRLTFHIDAEGDADLIDKVVSVTERYCVVLQTVVEPPPVIVSRTAAS